MGKPLLEVRDLRVDFKVGRKKKITAVSHLSFSIESEKVLGVVGESGCGKSVTAASILKLLPERTSEIVEGEILFDGIDIAKLSEEEMCEIRGSKISMIFQEPMTALNPVYTVGTQLVEMIRAHKWVKKEEAFKEAVDMLRNVGIPAPETRMKSYPHQLSGGLRQRVMIAMALSCSPALLIADEPTTALDVTIQAQILRLITELKRTMNTAVMLITHDMGVVAETADYVMVMYAGEIVEYAAAEEIFDRPLHPYTAGLLKSIPRLDRDAEELFTIEGTVPALDNMPEGCRFCARCTEAMPVCGSLKPDLFVLGVYLPDNDVTEHKVRCHKYADEAGKAD
jgi:oligopeptide/dipeptide ABC transporter ATP-binding protein